MSRTPLFGLVLSAAAAGLLFGWLGGKGRFGPGSDDPPCPVAQGQAGRGSDTAPLQPAAAEVRPNPVGAVESGETDVETVGVIPRGLVPPGDSSSEPMDPGAREAVEPELPKDWSQLVESAITAPDTAERSEAIDAIGIYRDAQGLAALAEAAVGDPDPDNRVEALQLLWIAAADGLDPGGEIKRLLEDARADPDPGVAALAVEAVDDLDRLARRLARGG